MNEQLIDNEVEKVRLTSQGSLPDLAGILIRRKAYLVLGAVLGIVLGVLFYAVAPRKYESVAQVWVLKKQTENPLATTGMMGMNSSASVMTQDFLETHRAVLKSHLVVGRAIEKAGLQDLEMFRGDDRTMDTIIQSMKVEREIDKKAAARYNSQVLNVSYRGKVPDECAMVVHAIMDSYQDFLNDSSSGPMKETVALISKANKIIKEDMEKKEKEYEKFRQDTPVLWKGPMGTTLYQDRLANIDAKRSSQMREQAEIEATLAEVDAAVKAGKGPAALMHILSAVPANREMPVGFATMSLRGGMDPAGAMPTSQLANPRLTMEDELLRLQMKEGELSEILGPSNPQIVSIREQITSLQALLAPSTIDASKPGALSEKDRVRLQRMADTKLAQLRQQLDENKRSQTALAELAATELAEAKKVFPFETQDDNYKRQLDRSYFLYENVLKRMEDLDLLSSVGGYDSQVITPPLPGEQVFPKAILVFPVALFMGLMTGFGLGYLAEVTDKNFHTPEEIRGRLGLPVIGHIPVLKEDKELLQKIEVERTPLHPRICTHYRPRSRDAEAYRAVRTALYFSTRGRGYKTIQVTSPNMGDGKSTLAANLAVSIAQSGKKVILIDADFRRPQQNELFGLTNTVGFASMLSGTATLEEALHETAVPGLSIIPSGPPPANPAELLTSQRFKEMLDAVAEQCDLVLIDTPPLLAVSDPSVIAPRVDGVVLALRLGKKSRPHAEQAKEVLHSLGSHILGVVVNAVRSDKGRYNYGYGGYGYGNYGSGENNRYYHEEHSESSNGTA